jgi:hypothetical protein
MLRPGCTVKTVLRGFQVEHEATLKALLHERPMMVPALKAFTAACVDSTTARAAANEVLFAMLDMQGALMEKREVALSCLREQPCATRPDGSTSYTCLRHVPDVLLMKLCGIAEVKYNTLAAPEWLAKMEARNAVR